MNPTLRRTRGFLARVPWPVVGVVAAVVAACSAASNAASFASQTAPAPAIVLISVSASPDSTLALTRLAMMEAEGTAQAIQWRPNAAILSTRYTRNRRGAGMTLITVMAAVGRKPADTVHVRTLIELRGWAMDSVATRRELGAPIMTTQTQVYRPRPLTFADSLDWASVDRVVQWLTRNGGRLVP